MAKKLIVVVLPGLEETFTRSLRPNNLFMSEDLPTLERPTKAISGRSLLGSCSAVPALIVNFTRL